MDTVLRLSVDSNIWDNLIFKSIKTSNLMRLLILAISLLSTINIYCSEHANKYKNIAIEKFIHNGMEREYIYYAPTNLPNEAPLLVVLHGFTSSAETIMEYSEFNKLAFENGFAVVYPQGTIDKDSNSFWNVGYTFHSTQTVNDVDFVVSLTEYLQNEYKLSKSNTFLTGMSNGGEMCYLLACKHPEVFAAVAPVAGMMLDSFFSDCNSSIIPPIFAVFGTNDDVTNYNGDPKNKDGWGAYPSIPSTVEFWVNRIKYDSLQIDTLPDVNIADGSFIVSERYSNSENEFKFYKVVNGGHDWPGSWGNMDVSISTEIWSFFNSYIR